MRKVELEALRAEAIEEPALPHRNLEQLNRQQVARLVEALNDEHHRTEAAEIICGLIDRIALTPKARAPASFRWARTARGRCRTAASRSGK